MDQIGDQILDQLCYLADDLYYLVKMAIIIPTFPLSVPIMLIHDELTSSKWNPEYRFYIPPRMLRAKRKREKEEEEAERIRAYQKTYAYVYSQPPYA